MIRVRPLSAGRLSEASPCLFRLARPMSSFHLVHGVILSRFQILHFGPVTAALALLVAGCAGHATAHARAPTSVSTGPVTQPLTEGTGPESPLQSSTGGVSVSVAALPIGDNGSSPTNEVVCVDVQWLGEGKLRPAVTLTVTSVVINGPFTPVDLATAGCMAEDGPPCIGLRITAADSGTKCAVGVKWTGIRATVASLELAGELSCPALNSATCQQVRDSLESKARDSGPVSFDFNLPPDTASPSSPGTSSPTSTDTSSPPSASTSPPPATGTSSP